MVPCLLPQASTWLNHCSFVYYRLVVDHLRLGGVVFFSFVLALFFFCWLVEFCLHFCLFFFALFVGLVWGFCFVVYVWLFVFVWVFFWLNIPVSSHVFFLWIKTQKTCLKTGGEWWFVMLFSLLPSVQQELRAQTNLVFCHSAVVHRLLKETIDLPWVSV